MGLRQPCACSGWADHGKCRGVRVRRAKSGPGFRTVAVAASTSLAFGMTGEERSALLCPSPQNARREPVLPERESALCRLARIFRLPYEGGVLQGLCGHWADRAARSPGLESSDREAAGSGARGAWRTEFSLENKIIPWQTMRQLNG